MRKGERTRATVLDHALAQASRVGLEGLSIGGLAKAVGLSKSGLFAHFDSKEALQLQVLDTAARRFIEKVITPALRRPRGEPRVRAMFDNWLDWEEAEFLPGGCPFIAMANELDDRPGPLRDMLASAQRDWLEALSTAARIAVDEGHFRAGLDTRQFAYEIYAIMLAYNHFRRLLRDPEAEPRARASFERLVETSRA
jgi:AcrR family transcriptional regulator